MRPFAIDANVIALFQHERISGEESLATIAINEVVNLDCIALDNERHCLQEWIDSAGGAFPFALTDWIDNMLISGSIKYYSLAPNNCRRALNDLGLPQKDHKWVRLAVGSGGKAIVSADIDFLDPSAKRASAATKAHVREQGSGPCSRGLKRHFDVDIHTLHNVRQACTRAV